MKVHIKFLTYIFLRSLSYVFLVTFSLVLILNVLTELDFFKDINVETNFTLFLAFLNSPSLTFEIFHQVHINGAPGNGLYVNKKDVFLGERFFWQVRKSKIHRKSYIGSYKSVYIPKPHNAKGRAFRDSKNLYFCSDVYSKPKVVLRSTIER